MYEWDEAKRLANLAKHGVDFSDMERFDWASCQYLRTEIVDYEQRDTLLGMIELELYVVVITEREENTTRVISMRRANRFETRMWNNE